MPRAENLQPPSDEGLPIVDPLLDDEQEARIQEFLTRGVDSVYPSAEALAAQMRERRMTAYMGVDPTAPEMHVGHVSQLRKMRRLQDMGHHVILLIGDFTGRIGDPTDKSASRVRLTPEQVLENAASYKEQAGKIIDFDHPTNPIDLRYNSEWLDQLNFQDVLELAANFTVQQLEEREMFKKRRSENKPINLTEFLYPLMQGYDSVAMDVDIELGGTDQIFNMLVGRGMMKSLRGKEKFVVAGDLLVDPSGKKIGKSEGNMITLTDTPEGMYQKVMLWGDAIVPHALELVSVMPMEDIEKISEQMKTGELDGQSAKMVLARTLVSELHSGEAATKAEGTYVNFREGNVDQEDVQEFVVKPGQTIIEVLRDSGLARGLGDARRLISQRGVRINGIGVNDEGLLLETITDENIILRVGKSNFRRIVIKTPEE